MKKTIVIILLAMFGLSQAVAQEYEYVPFVREGVKWVYIVDNPIQGLGYEDGFIPYGEHQFTLEIKGDTLIGDKNYKPVHLYSGNTIDEVNDTVPVYLREEDKVVYGIIPDDRRFWECPVGIGTVVDGMNLSSTVQTGVEFVLYDFNDPESFYSRYDYVHTDLFQIGNQLRKRLCFTYEGEYIIEGLGYVGIVGMPLNYFYEITIGLTQVVTHLSHVIENGEIVYKTEWYKEPEPDGYEYVPFVREGVKWVYSISYYNYDVDYYSNPARGDNIAYRTLELKGDTVINGKTYKAMHKYCGKSINEENDTIPVYLREEDKKVYGIIPDGKRYDDCPVYNYWYAKFFGLDSWLNGEEFLLYDFQDPETYWESLLNNYDLEDFYSYNHLYTDTIEIGNKLAKRYVGEIWTEYQTIEGIGLIGLNCTPLCLFTSLMPGINSPVKALEEVIEDGEVIYPQDYVEDRYLSLIREGVKWVNERVTVNNGDTTYSYYTYEFKGNHPEVGKNGLQRKALYRYDGTHHLDEGHDIIVAGLRENEAVISYYRNEPLNEIISQGRNMIDYQKATAYMSDSYMDEDYDLYKMKSSPNGWLMSKDYYIGNQCDPFLNDENFVKAEPIMIDGYRCNRLAYLDEQGDTLAYVVEGIGFDSYDMGDLLTPFTRKPDPNADYQEWCGLSHVVKDGEIIYKGMRYRTDVHVGIDEAVADKTRRPLDENYYDLMGRSVGKEVPTTPGIYIHQGKKIVVR